MTRGNDTSLLRCPRCLGALEESAGNALRCAACAADYPSLGRYHDLFVESRPAPPYPAELAHLHFPREGLLAMTPPPETAWDRLFGRRDFNRGWERDLQALQDTVRQAGCCERGRAEFMKDDEASPAFEHQRREVRVKARKIMRRVLGATPAGSRGGLVLHVGCGGRCNDGIPVEYARAGYVNHGVDAVRSYVEEFLDQGHAQLANALALPYADASFDVVNYTDILEHLFDPLGGLVEAVRVLRPGGLLMLDTPGYASIDRSRALSYLEYALGRAFPATRRRRLVTASWDGQTFFHTEFTARELRRLLSLAGLDILSLDNETFHPAELDGPPPRPSLLRRLTPAGSWFALARRPS
ncbi:Methyltransferase domain-containing protein [Humidesulfovibrio mexicanus]|uniref:Methyltransferase domain-containing protein n=1 Tax=Humidesulfovibrio mexicanus TaxID=147047 RepID=A0A239BVA3_9BACT|nr:methyltransferase domain-containing protein [Humidesulfovibrio mexicanus]SNS11957.1 Methyltransferase domain-containing protein [Humidesulfovibrio mexicanus]